MRSLQQQLLLWILSALSIGGLVLVFASYVISLDELGEVFDENLKQVALAAAHHHRFDNAHVPAVKLPSSPNFYEQEGDFNFVTTVWTTDGVLQDTSNPDVSLPFVDKTGLTRVNEGLEEWHVYSIKTDRGIVQAAQRASSREILAAEVASKSLIPTFALVVLIGVLLSIALRRGLRPLDRAARDVATRSETSLDPIRDDNLPKELQPLIRSLNALLRRLGEAFFLERKFVADAAHGLRTPVTALRLQAQLVERAPTAEVRAQAIADLKAGVERVQHLLVQLLELSRLDPEANLQKRERLSLAELARAVVSHLSVKAEHKGVDLGAEITDEAWIEGDRYQLAILLDNLVDNAIRYNEPDGVIDVSVSNNAGHPTITVRDNGPGIPDDERDRVFDRFYRGRDAQATTDGSLGSGLGLAIVRTIANQHQAAVTLGVPPDGKGLSVSVVFPPARA